MNKAANSTQCKKTVKKNVIHSKLSIMFSVNPFCETMMFLVMAGLQYFSVKEKKYIYKPPLLKNYNMLAIRQLRRQTVKVITK